MSERLKHASLLRDYARNCLAYEDGGSGLEDSFDAGAEALEWAEFLTRWVDYNHGKGESDRAWEEFQKGQTT